MSRVANVSEAFDVLMDLFDVMGLPRQEKPTERNGALSFSVDGPRGSTVIYRLWGRDVIDAWFGKKDSDSGGRALQGCLSTSPNQVRGLLKLHKRFFSSGRLKVLGGGV